MSANTVNKPSINSPQSNLSPTEGTETKASVKYAYNKNKTKKPKRNKSAFILFSIEARAKLKVEEGDNVNSNEMMVKLADLWKNLPPEERERYDKEAREDKKRYLEELDAFSKQNPSEVIQNKTKKNHVKKPCSAYALFLKEAKIGIKNENPNLKMADVLKIVSERWKNIDKDEKAKYEEKAKKEKDATRAKLGDNQPKADADTEALLKKKKVKQLEKIRKEIELNTTPNEATKLNGSIALNPNHERQPLYNNPLKFDLFPFGITQSTSNLFSTKTDILRPVPSYPDSENRLPSTHDLPQLTNPLLQAQKSLFTITSNLFPRESSSKDDNDANELLKLFDKSFRSSSELLIDLLNFDVNPAKRDSSELFNQNSLKLNSNPFASINDIANFALRGNGTAKPSKQETLNSVIMNALNATTESEAKPQENKENQAELLNVTTNP